MGFYAEHWEWENGNTGHDRRAHKFVASPLLKASLLNHWPWGKVFLNLNRRRDSLFFSSCRRFVSFNLPIYAHGCKDIFNEISLG